jgi:outer membrane protein insertion porin family
MVENIMKFGNFTLVLIVFSILFIAPQIRAQNAKPVKIVDNLGAIPFEDGKTVIKAITFTGLTALPESEILKDLEANRVSIKAGERFYGGRIAKAVKAIRQRLTIAGYYQAEVAAFGETVSKTEMKLDFVVKEGALFRASELRFEGNASATSDELLASFKQCLTEDWQIYSRQKYEFITRKCLLSLLYGKGYFQARIGAIAPQTVAGKQFVTIEITEGARFRNGDVRIVGARALTAAEITQMLNAKKGEVSDGRQLLDFVYEKLRKAYADKGYVLYAGELEPVFNEPLTRGADGVVNILIKINEGAQFKLRKIEFAGVDNAKAAQLRKLFLINDGEIYNQTKFEDGIRKIGELKEFAATNLDRDVETRADEKTNQVDLIVKLNKIEK